MNPLSKIKFVIHHATWDEWGRASKDCKSWGLCNYEDCWFCCIDTSSGDVVDCDDDEEDLSGRYGTFSIDASTNTGTFTIELNPAISEQNDAIINGDTLYVDEDIVKSKTSILKGIYLFNPSVGSDGGYILNAEGF
ncbi:hypothetical protein [Psychroserpens damuponensis]|uniref:hypothetical protein n=1 Tax=Psychroserpens damuponensis TaxID=943936 RepID=UPI00058B87CB|nr:hypothetical protein [Psychroserpens damuponensis]